MNKYIFVIQESHLHLGLFDDLKNKENVLLCPVTQKKIKNSLLKGIRRVHCSWSINKRIKLPFRKYWYKYPIFELDSKAENWIVIVDIALKFFSVQELNNFIIAPYAHGVLMMINSYNAESIGMLEVKEKIKQIKWEQVLTFDSVEAKQYGWDYMGTCYYSKHSQERIRKKYSVNIDSDVYFAGGIKGNREQLILDVFEMLYNAGVVVRCNVMVSGKKRLEHKKFEDKIHYYGGSWIPYESILSDVLNTNVIIEILQKGQHGPSLRYYEAVCYNKKLLTNNPNISQLPFYNPEYMKVFKDSSDIDLDWVKRREEIDYKYDGRFSPINLLNKIG